VAHRRVLIEFETACQDLLDASLDLFLELPLSELDG
jgi:hypothetical protein